jgi:hypothetical protein
LPKHPLKTALCSSSDQCKVLQHWSRLRNALTDESELLNQMLSDINAMVDNGSRDAPAQAISPKKLAFLAQNKAKLCKILIITLVFDKNAIFSPKIVETRRKL